MMETNQTVKDALTHVMVKYVVGIEHYQEETQLIHEQPNLWMESEWLAMKTEMTETLQTQAMDAQTQVLLKADGNEQKIYLEKVVVIKYVEMESRIRVVKNEMTTMKLVVMDAVLIVRSSLVGSVLMDHQPLQMTDSNSLISLN